MDIDDGFEHRNRSLDAIDQSRDKCQDNVDPDKNIETYFNREESPETLYSDKDNTGSIPRIQSSNTLTTISKIVIDPVKKSGLSRHSQSEPIVKKVIESPRLDNRLSNIRELLKDPLKSTENLQLEQDNIFISNLINESFVIQQNTLEKILDIMVDTNRKNMKRIVFITLGGLCLNITLFCLNFFK